MDSSRKKELINAYKQKPKNGGVFTIRSTVNDKRWIECTQDLEGMKNRFEFSVSTNVPIHYCLQEDWKALGASTFVYEVLEALPPQESEGADDYQQGLELLRDCLRQECPADKRYM